MEKELETKTKRTRTNESSTYALTTGSNVLYETAPAQCLDLVHTEQQQQAAAQQQMTEQMASGSDSVLWNEMVRIIEQEDVVQVIFKTATGKTITLDAEAGNTKDDEAMDAKASDDYQIKLHVIHAGVTIAVCNPYCEADGMTLEEIRDAFEEGLGRYLYKDGYGWKFNMPRQMLKKLIQDRWLLNGEVVGTEYNDGIVKPCDSLEVHMVVDADGDSESCRSESDSEHGGKTITLAVEASDTIETEI